MVPTGLILVGSAGPEMLTSPPMPKFMTFMGYMTRRSGPSCTRRPCSSTLSATAGWLSASDWIGCAGLHTPFMLYAQRIADRLDNVLDQKHGCMGWTGVILYELH